jgi:hypothetical protein
MNGEYIILKFPSATTIRAVTLDWRSNKDAPRGWKFMGSNDDGASWIAMAYDTGVFSFYRPTNTAWTFDSGSYKWFLIQASWTSAEFPIIQYPNHTMSILDTLSGQRLTAVMAQKTYVTSDEIAAELQEALRRASLVTLGSEIAYTVSSSGNRFTMSSPNGRPFQLRPSSFVSKIGFPDSAVGVSRTTVSTTTAQSFTLSGTTATRRVNCTIGITRGTVPGNPPKWQLVGSNDRVYWTGLDGYLLDPPSVSTLDVSSWETILNSGNGPKLVGQNYDVPLPVQDAFAHTDVHYLTQAYKYYRIVFPACRSASTSVCIAEMVLYTYDYASPLYRQVIDIDYTSLEGRDASYATVWDWLLAKYTLVQGKGGAPMLDYLVKEELDLAPCFDQTDTSSYFLEPSGKFEVYRPLYTSTAQKLISSLFAQGRYIGMAPAFASNNRGYTPQYVGTRDTRGDTDHKFYSIRFCHQLYSFVTDGGMVSNKIAATDTEAGTVARFTKRFELGMLTGVHLKNNGARYTTTSLSTSQVSMGSQTETILTSTGNDAIAEYAMGVLTAQNDTSTEATDSSGNVYTRLAPPFTDLSDALPTAPQFTITMGDSEEASFTDIASTKTPLLRSANFKLNFAQVAARTEMPLAAKR